jgi:hypothetical protein
MTESAEKNFPAYSHLPYVLSPESITMDEKSLYAHILNLSAPWQVKSLILGSKPGTIFTMLRDTGGIKPHERKRAVAHLTLSEREEIRAGLSAKMSIRAIATVLNRSPSTISLKWHTEFGHLSRGDMGE